MGKTLFTRKDLMERWGVSYQSIINYENNGTLTRNPNFENPMYYLEEVLKIESLNEVDPLSPLERRRLERDYQIVIGIKLFYFITPNKSFT